MEHGNELSPRAHPHTPTDILTIISEGRVGKGVGGIVLPDSEVASAFLST